VNLGAGFDTLFWRLVAEGRPIKNFIEVDFSGVTARKCYLIKRHRELLKEEGQHSRVFLFCYDAMLWQQYLYFTFFRSIIVTIFVRIEDVTKVWRMHDFCLRKSILGEFEAEFKKALAREKDAQGVLFDEKTEGQKSRDTVPLNGFLQRQTGKNDYCKGQKDEISSFLLSLYARI
jgi:hypothetical protein